MTDVGMLDIFYSGIRSGQFTSHLPLPSLPPYRSPLAVALLKPTELREAKERNGKVVCVTMCVWEKGLVGCHVQGWWDACSEQEEGDTKVFWAQSVCQMCAVNYKKI